MLSPYKLYKHDMKNKRVARTWGPKGKPSPGCSGSACYNHKHVDWTVHRLTPAVYDRSKKGGRIRKAVDKKLSDDKFQMTAHERRSVKKHLMKTSPRWGEGKVPSRMEGRKIVPLPKKGEAEISKKTYAATAVAVGGGAYAYKHRAEIKAKAHQFANKHPHFVHGIHSSHAH